MPPNTYSLVQAFYDEEKKGISAYFANAQEKRVHFFPFYPSCYLPQTKNNVFQKVMESETEKNIHWVEWENSIQLIARNWKELKEYAFRLYSYTHYFPLLIEPERQFLLTQNWHYFQSFDEKINPLNKNYSNTQIPFASEPLYATLTLLTQHNPEMEKELIRKISLSHELHIPLTDVPLHIEEQMETFLDNYLFSRHYAAPFSSAPKIHTIEWNAEQRSHAKEKAWESPIPVEGNCVCCEPHSIAQKNIHLGSMITAEATQDGVYFFTRNPKLSDEYNQKNFGKEMREKHAKEYGLFTLPIGPLHRNEKISIPLREALQEEENGTIRIHFEKEKMAWQCQKTPFVFTQLKQFLEEKILIHNHTQNVLVQPYLAQYQLAYTTHAQQNPQIQLHQETQKILQGWKEKIPWHLLIGNTKWRDERFASLLQNSV